MRTLPQRAWLHLNGERARRLPCAVLLAVRAPQPVRSPHTPRRGHPSRLSAQMRRHQEPRPREEPQPAGKQQASSRASPPSADVGPRRHTRNVGTLPTTSMRGSSPAVMIQSVVGIASLPVWASRFARAEKVRRLANIARNRLLSSIGRAVVPEAAAGPIPDRRSGGPARRAASGQTDDRRGRDHPT